VRHFTYKIKGFSLLEVTIVIMIIAILLIVVLPAFLRSVERSRGASAYTMLDAIKKLEHFHFAKNGEFIELAMNARGDIVARRTWNNSSPSTFLIDEIPELSNDPFWRYDIVIPREGEYNIVAKRYNRDSVFTGEEIWYYFDGSSGTVGCNPQGAY